MPLWNPIANPQNYVLFAGRRTPGYAEVIGVEQPRRLEEVEGYALGGAVIKYLGQKLAHFSVQITLVTEEEWNDWHAFMPLVQRVPMGKRQGPLDITHPYTTLAKIKSVMVENLVGPEQIDNSVHQWEIKLVEFRKPVFALAQPEGAEADPVDPEAAQIADQRKFIELLKNEFDDLANEKAR